MSSFLDFSEAFDCVDRRKLLEILRNCGIGDNQLKLMENFLISRKQRFLLESDSQDYVSDEKEAIWRSISGQYCGSSLICHIFE